MTRKQWFAETYPNKVAINHDITENVVLQANLAGVTTKDMAEKLNISPITFMKYVYYEREWRAADIALIAQMLDVSVSDLCAPRPTAPENGTTRGGDSE